jgi:transporter family-2 protein
MNWFIILAVLVAGSATAIQAGVNGALGKKTGILEAAFVSFLTGTVFLLILLLFVRKGNLSQALSVPKWQLTGGILGAIYILIMVFAVPRIGIAAALVTLIVGQLTCSTLLDHFGLIGERPLPIDLRRISGLLLMAVAVYLVYKK